MSLPARERQRLSGIEASLSQSDPQLVALFAIFSRLAREEEMPPIERLRVRVDRVATRGRRTREALVRRLRLIIIAPVALAATCAALLIGGWSSGPSACKAKPAATSSLHPKAPSLARAMVCRPAFDRTVMAGR